MFCATKRRTPQRGVQARTIRCFFSRRATHSCSLQKPGFNARSGSASMASRQSSRFVGGHRTHLVCASFGRIKNRIAIRTTYPCDHRHERQNNGHDINRPITRACWSTRSGGRQYWPYVARYLVCCDKPRTNPMAASMGIGVIKFSARRSGYF